MLKTWVAILWAALPSPAARADEGEMQVRITPGTTLLLRDDHTNVGFGGRAGWSYGVADFVDIEGTVGCDQIFSMERPARSSTGIEGSVIYDATRCMAVPGIMLRHHGRFVPSASVGLGYRVEVRSGRELGTKGVLLERLESRVLHELVAVGRVAAEYRLTPLWSFGVFAAITSVLAGAATELDLHAGLVAAAYFYP
jgi:hypothetical protein